MTHLCMHVTALRMVYIAIAIAAALLSISVIIHGIIQSYVLQIHDQEITQLKLLRPFKITYYITSLCWLVGTIGFIVYTGFVYLDALCLHFDMFNNVFGVGFGYVGYSTGLVGLYCLFLLRLKYNFLSTPIELSHPLYLLLISLGIIQIIPIILGAYFYITMQWHIALPIDYTFKALNAICLCILWIMFVRNMLRLQQHFRISKHMEWKQWIIHPDETNTETSNVTSNQVTQITVESDKPLSMSKRASLTQEIPHKMHDMVELVVKYTICASIAFMSSFCVSFVSFYRGFVMESFDLMAVHIMLAVVDIAINSICLHLQFSYAVNHYNKICKPLRKVLISCVVRQFNPKIKEQCDNVINVNTEI
eukprot:400393_1